MPTTPTPETAIPTFRVPSASHKDTLNTVLGLKLGRFAFISKSLNMQVT